jgi:hypothetical protein
MTTHDNHPLARKALYLTTIEVCSLLVALSDADWYARQILESDEDEFDMDVARRALKDNAALATRLEALLPKD